MVWRWARDLLIGLAVTAAIFAVAEWQSRRLLRDPVRYRNLALNLFYSPHQQPLETHLFELNRRLFWRFIPGFKMDFRMIKHGGSFPLQIDENGLRIEHLSSDHVDLPVNYLIASFGDSCTAGLEVGETYTKILAEKLIRKYPGIHVGVRNAGTNGYSSEQGLRQVQDFVKAGGRPQLSVIHFGHNDATPAFEDIADKDLSMPVFYKLRLRKWLTRSYAAVLLFDWLQTRHPGLRRTVAVHRRVSPGDFRENIREMTRLLTATGSQVVLVGSAKTAPEPGYNPPEEIVEVARQLSEYDELLRHIAEEEGVLFADVATMARAAGNELFFNDPDHDTTHAGPEGHAMIADLIFKQVVD